MKTTTTLEKYVKSNVKKSSKTFMTEKTGGDNIMSIDFYSVLNSKFSLIPQSREDRQERMKQVNINNNQQQGQIKNRLFDLKQYR